MNRQQVIELFKVMDVYYTPKAVLDPTAKIEAWLFALKDYDSEMIYANLMNHVERSAFPPTIADLVKKQERSGRYIPDSKETQLYLEMQDSIQPASPDVAAKYLAEIRQTLNIDRGDE